MTTGAAHWELLSRARAVDNQVSFLLSRSCSVLTLGPKPESLSRTLLSRFMWQLPVLLGTLRLAMLPGATRLLSSETSPLPQFRAKLVFDTSVHGEMLLPALRRVRRLSMLRFSFAS